MKTTILSLLLLIVNNVHSQIITENINFNNYVSSTNNDLTNNFTFPIGSATNFITQSNIGGITGGALIPPNTINWGNDIIRYCSTYKNTVNSMIETSICFKYNTSLINPNSFERPVSIWMYGTLNGRNIHFFLNRDRTLSITSYNYAESTFIPTMTNGNWFKIVAKYMSIGGTFGDQIYARAEIFDIGPNGTSTPISVGNHTATIYDVNLVSSTKFTLGLSAAKWGGAEYIDNFIFKGEKDGTICNSLGINENITNDDNIQLYPNPTKDNLNIKSKTIIKHVTLYNALGQVLSSIPQNSNKITIDLSFLPTNNYFIKIETDDKKEVFKIIKE
jgi:hypothetical protein